MNPADIGRHWQRLQGAPGGKLVFSKLLGVAAPYTGSISPRVVTLERGLARVQLRDKRAVRNHLKCIHAVALVNLAELTCNLALYSALAPEQRMIVTGFQIEYLKKARGTITAECRAPAVAAGAESRRYEGECTLTSASGEVVARAKTTCLVDGKTARASRSRAA